MYSLLCSILYNVRCLILLTEWQRASALMLLTCFWKKKIPQMNLSCDLGFVLFPVFPLGSVDVHGAAEGDREVPTQDHT